MIMGFSDIKPPLCTLKFMIKKKAVSQPLYYLTHGIFRPKSDKQSFFLHKLKWHEKPFTSTFSVPKCFNKLSQDFIRFDDVVFYQILIYEQYT